MLKFLIADDHPLYREALIGALQPKFTNVNFVESDSLDSTLKTLRRHRNVSLVLLDLNMPGCDNYYGLLRILQSFPSLPVAVVSASDTVDVISQVMQFGAHAFIPKTTATDDIVKALEQVQQGNKWLPEGVEEKLSIIEDSTIEVAQSVRGLTPKQFQVLKLVKQGLTNKQIANELDVTEATVKAHVSTLFKRLNVRSRTQILVAIEKLTLE